MQKLVEMVFDAEAEAQSRLDAAQKKAASRRMAVETEISALLEKTRASALALTRASSEEARQAGKKLLEETTAEQQRLNAEFTAAIGPIIDALIVDLMELLIQTDLEKRTKDA